MGLFSLFRTSSSSSSTAKYPRNRPPRETHGPVVQSGPTAGQNRVRNGNGQWRKKRSDAK
jgi:hypothetical protein